MEDITDYFEQVKKAAYESHSPRLVEKTQKRIEEYRKKYPNDESLPQFIAPTENGWHDFRTISPSDNRHDYRIVVTSKNSNRVEERTNIGERRVPHEILGTALKFIE
jgi:hypothetical protein